MLNTAFSPWPSYSEEEAKLIQAILLSNKVNYWTGSECKLFEQEFASWVGVNYAISLTNGTVALEIALKAINLNPEDEVIVTCRTFLASASAIVTTGGIPVFADVDENSQNITADSIRKHVTPRTKAIICVHLAGWPCDMDPIMDIAKEHNIYVIEDCAQAHGAKYKGKSVGSIGHIGTWSFCQDKIMTTGGEGGMITTNDSKLWSTMWALKDHGKSYNAIYKERYKPGFRWIHNSFGSNGRMTEMQAGIGRYQLKQMPAWHTKRLQNAKKIWQTASNLRGLRVPIIPEDITHAAYKCYIFVKPEELALNWNRDRIVSSINEQNVPCYQGTCPEVYLEKAFDDTAWRPKDRLKIAANLGQTSMMFLVHPTLSTKEIEKTCTILQDVMQQAT